MTHKFKVGDRVQFVAGNKHRLGAIVSEKNKNSYIVEDDHDTYIIHKNRVAPAPALVKIPAVVDKFLKTDADGYTIYDRMAQLIVVNDGDHYHLEEAAIENEVLSREEALEVINYAHEAKCEDLLQLINGYEIEKEPLYMVELPNLAYQTYLVKNDDGILAWQNTGAGTKFTESEIKAIDERYWQFAVPEEGK
ncbi:DUF1642 domain-containing protein [Listeria booriae]|uniref:DUF1642 domain-containing protein n=1 Tax=Listeria booriae TaxID=1552123 RepID=UPI001627E42C|nr:DUF1642 domain-containing protein [Listeria booriae]MBC2318765.1 DUF1642 domain-containing protein [Listeria booriae]